MRVSRGRGLRTKALPRSHAPLGFWLCKGVKDCPSLLRPLLPGFCSLFLAVNYAKGGGKGRVGGGEQGGSLKDWGDWACKEGAIPVPLRPAPALSHGVLEKKGAGWPDWLARPWGQREGPRPARGAAQLHSPPFPSPPASPGRECLVPAAPSLGPEGRAGRAASYPLLLPTSSPPRCELEPPPPLPPLTHAAPGLAGRRVWDGVRGWGGSLRGTGELAPPGGRALRGRAPPAAASSGLSSRILTTLAGERAPPCQGAALATSCLAVGKVGCGPVEKGSLSHILASRASQWAENNPLTLLLGLNPPTPLYIALSVGLVEI